MKAPTSKRNSVITFLKGVLFFALLYVQQSFASLHHISLYDTHSSVESPLLIKLNFIAKSAQEPKLRFVLSLNGKKSVLPYKFVSQYMLLLKSQLLIEGKARLEVFIVENSQWALYKTISLPYINNSKFISKAPPSNVKPNNTALISTPTAAATKPYITAPSLINTSVDTTDVNCKLNNLPRETLWTIASHHKADWKTSIYGAMVAIYYANKDKFAEGSIERLAFGHDLNCPSADVLSTLSSKEKMKSLYMSLK